jgi:flagellar motor switch protein FliG
MTRTTPTKLDPIRKAAILISTLDHRVADELLDRMSDEQAALVRRAAMALDDVSESEQKLVMREFLGSGGPVDELDDSGIELDEELARKLAASESYAEHPRTSSEPDESPFRFLCDAETDAIAKHLRDENPQIIAVVIAHLPPRQAADLLKHFQPQLQANLLRRIAELDTADRDVVREVEKHLRMLLHDDLRAAQNRAIGLSTVASILTAAGETRGHLVSSLTRHDRQLARQLRTPIRRDESTDNRREGEIGSRLHDSDKSLPAAPTHSPVTTQVTDNAVNFEELARLCDSDLALVFRESDSKLALLALAGATPAFVGRLLKQLPPREAKSLRRRMERLGPLRLSDIAEAQSAIAEIADRLIAAGAIDSPQPEHFAVAA